MPTNEHYPERDSPAPGNPVPVGSADLLGGDEELAGMLAELAARRPAAAEVGLAALRLVVEHPAELVAYIDQAPPPGPDADDEDLLAWVERTDQLREWLADGGRDVVTVRPAGVGLRVVES